MAESRFQSYIIKRIKELFPGAMILKNDPGYIQGIPDLSIFYKDKWATLEVKDHEKARRQPNQPYYVELMNNMSFSDFIFPENEIEVMDRLIKHFNK